MENVDYLIIGGGIAGTVAAETARKHDAQVSILIITAEAERLYSRVMLVRYLNGSVDRDRLFLRQRSDYERQIIDIRYNETVRSLDATAYTVTTASGATIEYRKLVIATGGQANTLDVPGANLAGIHAFKTIEDTDALRNLAATAKEIVVVGGGFVALELVDVFASLQAHVTVVLREQGFFDQIAGERGSAIIASHFASRGVSIKTNATVEAIMGDKNVEGVKLSTGETIPANMVALGIGQSYLQPWMTAAGLETVANAIKTNEFLETNIPDVYAAGDAAAFYDPAAGHNHRLGSWLNAQLHGMAVGASITGTRTPVHSTSFYRADFGGQSLVCTGDLARDGRTIVEREIGEGKLERYYLQGDTLMGAVLLNQPERIREVQQMVGEQNVVAANEFEPVTQ